MAKFGIISRLPTTQTYSVEVNAAALQDVSNPVNTNKGSTIIVTKEMQELTKRVQDDKSSDWVLRPWMLWINRPYAGDCFNSQNADPLPKAECISAYGNFVQILGEITTRGGKFYKIDALPYTTKTFPKNFDWYYYPTLFVKCSARNRKGVIYNVGNGFDAYFPLLRRTNYLWIHSSYVEVFPNLPPEGKSFILRGMSVYMSTSSGIKPLRLARNPSELSYPDPRWKLKTAGVIPEIMRSGWIEPT